jgi:hypothetical protein
MDEEKKRKISFTGEFFDKLTPSKIRSLSFDELHEFIKVVQSYRIDYEVVRDLMKDRNDMRLCYNKLKNQLLDEGLTPCIDYYRLHNKE